MPIPGVSFGMGFCVRRCTKHGEELKVSPENNSLHQNYWKILLKVNSFCFYPLNCVSNGFLELPFYHCQKNHMLTQIWKTWSPVPSLIHMDSFFFPQLKSRLDLSSIFWRDSSLGFWLPLELRWKVKYNHRLGMNLIPAVGETRCSNCTLVTRMESQLAASLGLQVYILYLRGSKGGVSAGRIGWRQGDGTLHFAFHIVIARR